MDGGQRGADGVCECADGIADGQSNGIADHQSDSDADGIADCYTISKPDTSVYPRQLSQWHSMHSVRRW